MVISIMLIDNVPVKCLLDYHGIVSCNDKLSRQMLEIMRFVQGLLNREYCPVELVG